MKILNRNKIVAVVFQTTSNDIVSIILPLLALGIYLLAAYVLAVFARQLFDSNQGLVFVLNVSSVVVVISLIVLASKVGGYVQARQRRHSAHNAVADAPYIHLEAPFVKKVQKPTGGVILFLHVPFTVSRNVRAQSLMILAPWRHAGNKITYSSNPDCNSGYEEPAYGFHLVTGNMPSCLCRLTFREPKSCLKCSIPTNNIIFCVSCILRIPAAEYSITMISMYGN